jgi:hypothetical protein
MKNGETANEPRRLTERMDWVCVLAPFCLLLSAFCLSAAEPFLQLRQTTLGYHGPSEDLTNLTELRLGWFGPTNLKDPLTGDLWWAANLAVRDANDAQGRKSETRDPKSEGSPNSEIRSPNVEAAIPVRSSGFGPPSALGPRPSDFHRLPFRLVPCWSVDPWGTGVSQLTRMVYDEQPLALLGSVDSASTHLAEQVVAKANLPLVSPFTTDKSVTLAGVSWMFSCAPSDAAIARILVDGVLTALGEGVPYAARSGASAERRHLAAPGDEVRRSAETPLRQPEMVGAARSLVLLACTDHESRMTTREVMHEFSRRGRMPDLRLDLPPNAADLSQQMARLADSKPAVVLILAGAEDSARLVKVVRARLPGAPASVPATASGDPLAGPNAGAPKPVIFGSQSMGRTRFQELAGSAAESVRFPRWLASNPADPRLARFTERFREERGRAPDHAAVMTYDATCLLIEAIHRAGPNRARVREALQELSPWSGLAGSICFDGTGQNARTNLCLQTLRTTLTSN